MNLSPAELDDLARTVVGEAGDQPDQGQQAVASTIFNRLNAGTYGKSIHDVVLAPKQFSAWNDPRKLIALDPNSKDYQRAIKNVQTAAADGAPDYSGGATHYFAPALTNGKTPSWAKNQTAEIGGHKFYAPNRRVAQQSDDDVDRELQSFGLNTGKKAEPSAPVMSDEDVDAGLRSFGLTTAAPSVSSAPPAGANETTRLAARYGMQPGVPALQPSGNEPSSQQVQDIVGAPGAAVSSVKSAFGSAVNTLGQGYNALKAGDILPSGLEWRPGATTTLTGEQRPTSTPVFTNPGGLAKTAQGIIGMPASIFAGLNPVSDILTKTTGNPEFGQKATMLIPGSTGAKVVKASLPANQALRTIVEQVGRDKIPNVLQRLESNPRLTLMDVSEPGRTLAGGLASDPTLGAQNIMRDAYEARTSARKDIVRDAMEETLGSPPNVKTTLDKYKANIQQAGKGIEPVLKNAGLVDLSPVIQSIDQQLGPQLVRYLKTGELPPGGKPSASEEKLMELRRRILGSAPLSDIAGETEPAAILRTVAPEKAHELQSALRAEGSKWMESADGAQRHIGGSITMPIRQQIVDAIDQSSGGAYKPALAKYREANQIDEAFEKGMGVLKTNGVEDFPEYWKAWKAEASPDELEALRLGVKTAFRQTIEGLQSGARRGENVIAPDFVRERVQTAFGPKKTEDFAKLLQDAKDMTETNARLYQNSKTATTTAAQNALRVREPGKAGPGALTPLAIGSGLLAGGYAEMGLMGLGMSALRGAHTGAQYIGRAVDRARNAKLAQYLSAGEGPLRDELINALRNAQSTSTPSVMRRWGGMNQPNMLSPMLFTPTMAAGRPNTPVNALAPVRHNMRGPDGRFIPKDQQPPAAP